MADIEQSVSLEQAQQLIDGFSTVNLDEVSPETVTVTFREFLPDTMVPAGYRIETTTKNIRTFVPMFLFNRMQANQKKIQRMRKKSLLKAEFKASDVPATESPEEEEETFDFLQDNKTLNYAAITHQSFKDTLATSDPSLVWQATEVLAVWQMTPGEEEMTLKRLMLGLDFEKIEALFLRFFVEKIQKRRIKA